MGLVAETVSGSPCPEPPSGHCPGSWHSSQPWATCSGREQVCLTRVGAALALGESGLGEGQGSRRSKRLACDIHTRVCSAVPALSPEAYPQETQGLCVHSPC